MSLRSIPRSLSQVDTYVVGPFGGLRTLEARHDERIPANDLDVLGQDVGDGSLT
jgi:hypothetical protein